MLCVLVTRSIVACVSKLMQNKNPSESDAELEEKQFQLKIAALVQWIFPLLQGLQHERKEDYQAVCKKRQERRRLGFRIKYALEDFAEYCGKLYKKQQPWEEQHRQNEYTRKKLEYGEKQEDKLKQMHEQGIRKRFELEEKSQNVTWRKKSGRKE